VAVGLVRVVRVVRVIFFKKKGVCLEFFAEVAKPATIVTKNSRKKGPRKFPKIYPVYPDYPAARETLGIAECEN
jgi:hypothetical protein